MSEAKRKQQKGVTMVESAVMLVLTNRNRFAGGHRPARRELYRLLAKTFRSSPPIRSCLIRLPTSLSSRASVIADGA
jgi:hypothetical protein